MDLNDRGVVREFDPSGVLELVEGFGGQCRAALALTRTVSLRPLEVRPGLVALAGMGGSAAGGDFVRMLFEAQGTAPFVVVRDYTLPHCLGLGDLCFCVSYSGDTEETLGAYDVARHTGARIIVVTSGGELRRRAEADGRELYLLPPGQPPRTALGYLLVPVIVACERFRLIPEQDHESVCALLETLAAEWGVEAGESAPKALARELHGKLPILYGLGAMPGVIANRWRCQINENAKQLAFANAYPELDHNEIMGWVNAPGTFRGVLLEGDEDARLAARAAATEEIIGVPFWRVRAWGDSLLARMLSLAYFGDWVSIYLARLNEVDPADIGRIDRLKSALADF